MFHTHVSLFGSKPREIRHLRHFGPGDPAAWSAPHIRPKVPLKARAHDFDRSNERSDIAKVSTAEGGQMVPKRRAGKAWPSILRCFRRVPCLEPRSFRCSRCCGVRFAWSCFTERKPVFTGLKGP